MKKYFTVWNAEKAILYSVAIAFVAGTCIAVTIQPFLDLECDKPSSSTKYQNPSYIENLCKDDRIPMLLFLTISECIFARRIIMAVVLGGLIGWERREADRPAGIRTMALVSLGSCLFSITSAFAFIHGPMSWDSSRVAAAIPSGVGFLGSALIFKQQEDGAHMVHGLTTAASVWLSAAVGIACSGGLYFVASFSTAIMLLVLRFGPRFNYEDKEDDDSLTGSNGGDPITSPFKERSVHMAALNEAPDSPVNEISPLMRTSIRSNTSGPRATTRQRPSITVE